MMNDSSSVKQGPDYVAGRVGNSERFERTQGTTLDAGAQRSASRPYWQADAREILRVAGFGSNYGDLGIAAEQCEYGAHFIVIDETGVSPNSFLAESPSLLWKPCHELMDGPDAPDARLTPGLPFPFNAPQLAMFMLDGPGAFVSIAFGEWLIEPDQGMLNSMHIDANRAREAVRAAFTAYHQAVGVVGESYLEPEAQEAEAHRRYEEARAAAVLKHHAGTEPDSRDQYWSRLKLVNKEVAPLRRQRRRAKKTSELARSLWRKAMVKELSRLSALQTEPHFQGEVAVDAAASSGVESDKTGPEKPLQRTAAQDAAILGEIEKQGYDPLALPKNPPGKPGAKAAIRTALSENSLFTGGTVFDKAWERLTARADIAIQG